MAEIINLRQRRKDKARGEKDKAAEENRARFGQTKAQKKKTSSEKEKAEKFLDGAKREQPDDDEE